MALLSDAKRSQLLVIDQQTRLAGAMPADAVEQVLQHSSRLIQAAQSLDIPVLVSEQYPKGLGETESLVKQQLDDRATVFEKTRFSCCGAEGYNQLISKNNRPQLILTGMETHVCVLQTAMDLLTTGYEVFVVEDAVCSRDIMHKNNALQRLQQAGVIISNYESVLFEWLRDAKHPQFKSISALLK